MGCPRQRADALTMGGTGVALGIDACPAGWAVCSLSGDGDCSLLVVDCAEKLMPLIERCDLACIDIPIGIPEDAERDVDRRAKSILGRYHARVFMTPLRPVIAQTDYAAANAEHRCLIGKGLSKQTWNILPRVREIDEMLAAHPGLRDHVRECHPEIALWGMAGRVITSNKQTEQGKLDRLGVLAAALRDPPGVLESARDSILKRDAKNDDLIDAMICAATAAGVWDNTLRPLISPEPNDVQGLPMNIWYRSA